MVSSEWRMVGNPAFTTRYSPYFTTPISRKYFSTPGWINATSCAAATVFAARNGSGAPAQPRKT